eukprot:TRINITY_DN2183_c0_g1_i5.p1 TRINITY_DN2183_c0_g1~~TRINITY_DN2183_c0_g1_i5.p1  ORF type:complete len:462 (+),score=121.44 TRINITY_DN2183_c0_g1_i5:298-1683(+)
MHSPLLTILLSTLLLSVALAVSYSPSDFPERRKIDGWPVNNQEAYNGWLSCHSSGSLLYYQLQAAVGLPLNTPAPLILWLQGGPGYSSLYGNYIEVGSLTLETQPDGVTAKAVRRENSWNDRYHMLFVDSPVQVGYSVSFNGYSVNNTLDTANALVTFLQKFFTTFADTGIGAYPFYIFGESYAGHTIPALAARILETAQQTSIKLAGIGIGNPWIDPYLHVDSWDSFAYINGVLTEKSRAQLKSWQNDAKQAMKATKNTGGTVRTREVFDLVMEKIKANVPGINVYNLRQFNMSLTTNLTKYMNMTETRRLLAIPDGLNFTLDNTECWTNYSLDFSLSQNKYFETILKSGIRVLIFQGRHDLVCNYVGVWEWLVDINDEWFRQGGYGGHIRDAPKQYWQEKVDGSAATVGIVRAVGDFVFALVNVAGHMVPFDQPQISNRMIDRFISGAQDWEQIQEGTP